MELLYTFDAKRFQLGSMCIRGHAWPGTQQSLRRIHPKAPNCVACTGRKQSDWLISFLDYKAMGWPSDQTLGKLCPQKHQWNNLNVSLRKHGHCVECEKTRKRKQLEQQRKTNRQRIPELIGLAPVDRRRRYRQLRYEMLRRQGLTVRGTAPIRVDGGVRKGRLNQEIALDRAIQRAGRCPSVARLVMDEQKRYWRQHPEARREHDRQWRQVTWWLEYQTRPDKRLYVRQKSKRRKALLRQLTAHQIKSSELRARFAQFGNCCAYCGAAGDMQIEHVVPISKGGTHAIGNIVPACEDCNSNKLAHEVEAWYRQRPSFTELRWRKICRALGWHRSGVGQLALL